MEMTIRLEEREHSHALCVDVSQDMWNRMGQREFVAYQHLLASFQEAYGGRKLCPLELTVGGKVAPTNTEGDM